MTEGPARSCGFRHGLGMVHREDLPCDPVERDRVMAARIALMGRGEARLTRPTPPRPTIPRPRPPSPNSRWRARVAVLVLMVSFLVACGQSRDVEGVEFRDADRIEGFNNVDEHPNLVRLCIGGLAFVTTTREHIPFERVPEWDESFCGATGGGGGR